MLRICGALGPNFWLGNQIFVQNSIREGSKEVKVEEGNDDVSYVLRIGRPEKVWVER